MNRKKLRAAWAALREKYPDETDTLVGLASELLTKTYDELITSDEWRRLLRAVERIPASARNSLSWGDPIDERRLYDGLVVLGGTMLLGAVRGEPC